MSALYKFGTIDFSAYVLDWVESAPKRSDPQITPRKHGVTLSEDPTWDAREVSVTIRVHGTDGDNARDVLDGIIGAFPTGADKLYKYADRYLNAYFMGEERNFAGSIGDVIETSLRFLCHDPFYYTTTPVQDTQNGKVQGNTFVINNTGKMVVFPVLTITPAGGNMTSFTLRNSTISPTRSWSFQGTVVAGNNLVVNFEQNTVLNNGVNALSDWKTAAGSAADRLWLIAGNNTLEIVTLTPNNPPTVSIQTAFTPRWN